MLINKDGALRNYWNFWARVSKDRRIGKTPAGQLIPTFTKSIEPKPLTIVELAGMSFGVVDDEQKGLAR